MYHFRSSTTESAITTFAAMEVMSGRELVESNVRIGARRLARSGGKITNKGRGRWVKPEREGKN